ncbi:hypothetical protein SAMN04488012_10635 [Palleronia salina]|uniref:Uncharacterized protein n=1 Tax=Palleronia salina TaxID=313368 RepID=A0A1M6HJ51_9RHOB|nr:hypothetical protein [Palleronia salina]SHJ22215.1 hypothetical protein SAMN04488012_10635 [Palleronia salina]
MSLLEELADKLAQEALHVAETTGDETAIDRVAEAIGASSTTMEEAYLTAVRVRRAEARARALLAELKRDAGP